MRVPPPSSVSSQTRSTPTSSPTLRRRPRESACLGSSPGGRARTLMRRRSHRTGAPRLFSSRSRCKARR
eukprot:PRCOL_00000712-RA